MARQKSRSAFPFRPPASLPFCLVLRSSHMDVNDLKGLFAEASKRMKAAIDHLQHEFAGVRTGRASVTILDGVHVDAYGSKIPLNQVAGLSIPHPTPIPPHPSAPSQPRP